jgi:hypothetical protein
MTSIITPLAVRASEDQVPNFQKSLGSNVHAFASQYVHCRMTCVVHPFTKSSHEAANPHEVLQPVVQKLLGLHEICRLVLRHVYLGGRVYGGQTCSFCVPAGVNALVTSKEPYLVGKFRQF